MSLIVARKSENQLSIVSDTKLIYPNHEVKGLKSNPSEGMIKSIIISPDICVSFAGNFDEAENAFKEIQAGESLDKIMEILKRFHKLSNYKTEFLLCYGQPEPTIYKFKNNEYGPVTSSWIGDQKAFNRFQESMNGIVKK